MTTSSPLGESVAKPSCHQRLALGVDGGGTKTQAWLAQIDDQGLPQIIGRGIAGSSNWVAVGLETALENLNSSVDAAFAKAELTAAPIASAVFALAGSAAEEVRREVLRFAKQRLRVESAQVIHDGLAVLQAAAPGGWGIALIAGTGAVAYGVNQARETAIVGGWGYWFGDEGSAYWLGQSALRAIAQADDGRATATSLSVAVLDRLQIAQPREIISALSGGGTARRDAERDARRDVRMAIADLAELVCEAAENQDEVAGLIVAEAARHWSQHIQCLTQQLKLDKQFPLALAGGVLGGSPIARERLVQQLEVDQLRPTSVEFVAEPVAGCLHLACRDFKSLPEV